MSGELRTLVFDGTAKFIVTSPKGVEVAFRLAPILDDAKKWDGRAWWLWRGKEYVGIVKRAGQAFELKFTARSTTDRVIQHAAAVMLVLLGPTPDEATEKGYTLRSDT